MWADSIVKNGPPKLKEGQEVELQNLHGSKSSLNGKRATVLSTTATTAEIDLGNSHEHVNLRVVRPVLKVFQEVRGSILTTSSALATTPSYFKSNKRYIYKISKLLFF